MTRPRIALGDVEASGMYPGRRSRTSCATASAALVILAILAGCLGSHPQDSAGDRRLGRGMAPPASPSASVREGAVPPPPERIPQKVTPERSNARVVARARSRALATEATKLFYGDIDGDGVFAIDKAGGDPTRIARRAPVSGGLALDAGVVAWIASPGDAVLRAQVEGGLPTVVRDNGIFSCVAARGGHLFVAEAFAVGGALARVSEGTATRIATFDGPPRGLLVDDAHAYVLTPTRLFKVAYDKGAHERAEVVTLASGLAFEHPQLEGGHVYFVAAEKNTRVLVRSSAVSGAETTTLARDVRDAPIAVAGGEVFYFDASLPQIRAVRTSGALEPRVVAEHDALSGPTALATDGKELFVATGEGPTAAILAFAIRPAAK